MPPGCAATATGGSFYQWKDVAPFGVPDVAAFLPALPPELTSSEFTKDYNEVKRGGSINTSARPPDRSDVARFYQASSPTLLFSQAARQVAAAEHRSMSENARALALLSMATSDSYVVAFSAKYHYNFWRPENAIRFLDDYGNPKTEPDPTYLPYISTPCFPSYPSNHASGSNGAAEMLRRLYGAAGFSVELTSPNPALAGISLQYSQLRDIVSDVSDARVYGGIHFRFDQDAGERM